MKLSAHRIASLVLPVAWGIWFAVLVGSPYFLGSNFGPALASVYGFLAVGLLAGIYVRDAVSLIVGLVKRIAVNRGFVGSHASRVAMNLRRLCLCACGALCAVFIVASLLFAALNWVLLPFYDGSLAKVGIDGYSLHIPWAMLAATMIQQRAAFMFCAGFACSCTGEYLFGLSHGKANRKQEDKKRASDSLLHSHASLNASIASSKTSFGIFALVILSVCAGFCVRAAFLALFEGCDNHGFLVIAPPQPFLLAVLPILLALFYLLLMVWVHRACGTLCCIGSNGRCMFARSCLAPFALGMLGWAFLSRILPVYQVVSPVFVVVLSVLTLTGFTLLAHAASRQKDHDKELERGSVSFAAFALSPREEQAAILIAKGLSFEEAAQKLGIKAATVRSLMRRVYEKMGVASKEGFLEACRGTVSNKGTVDETAEDNAGSQPSDAADRSENDAAHPSESVLKKLPTDTSFARECVWWFSVAAACIVLLPHCLVQEAWGLGRELIYGVTFAVLLAWIGCQAALVQVGTSTPSAIGYTVRLRSSVVAHTAMITCFLGITSLVSGAVLLGCSIVLTQSLTRDSGMSLVLFLAAFVFSLCLIANVSLAQQAASGKQTDKEASEGASDTENMMSRSKIATEALVFAALALTAVSFASPAAWVLSGVLALFGMGAGVLVLGFTEVIHMRKAPVSHDAQGSAGSQNASDRHRSQSDYCGQDVWGVTAAPNTQTSSSFALLLPVAFACGLLWEETWRDQGFFSLLAATIPFVVVASGAAVVIVCQVRRTCGACFVAGVTLMALAVFAFSRDAVAAVVPLVFLIAAIVMLALQARVASIRELVFAAAVYGIGCMSSDYVINAVGDRLTGRGFTSTMILTAPESLEIIAMYAAGALVLLAALAFVFFCVHVQQTSALDISLAAVSASSEDRMYSYLRGRGLSEAYASIVLDIARGRSSAQIAAERCYARGSINAARHIGYRTLGVHSQAELVELLKRETSC